MEISKATHNDGQFILESIVLNARSHFHIAYEFEEVQVKLRDQIISVMETRLCPTVQGKVKGIDNIPVGFIWLMHRTLNESEIYMCVTLPNYRRKGIFKKILSNCMNNFESGHHIYARVRRKSKVMYHILKMLNFKKIRQLNPFKPKKLSLIYANPNK